jgi:hypothetical protein
MWCSDNRPGLAAWMTVDRFQRLLAPVANTVWDDERRNAWSAQVAFLTSSDGAAYHRDIVHV